MLTHHINVRRRVPRAGHQAGGAANHFNAVINRGIGGGITKVPHFTDGGWQVVIGVVADEKAA